MGCLGMFVGGVVALAFLGSLLIGVWIPDVIFAPRRVVARQTLSNGIAVQVVQYWPRETW